jgi:hypothetical protein
VCLGGTVRNFKTNPKALNQIKTDWFIAFGFFILIIKFIFSEFGVTLDRDLRSQCADAQGYSL